VNTILIRDRPFNLKGRGYGFLFRSEFFFRKTQELEYLFFMSRKAEFNIRLYDKNSKLDYFFFLHQNQNIFFSNIGKQDIFFEKNHNHPFKLNGRSLTSIARHNTTERIVTEIRLLTRVRRYIYCLS
jgi:hypothetical protein